MREGYSQPISSAYKVKGENRGEVRDVKDEAEDNEEMENGRRGMK